MSKIKRMSKIKKIVIMLSVSVCLLLCSCLIVGCSDGGSGSAHLRYKLIPFKGYMVSGIGKCTENDIVIPATHAGYSVIEIGEGAFKGVNSITSVTIPDSVTRIGHDAFSGCKSLTSVTIPDSVTSVGVYLFDGCSKLTDVTIGNGVRAVDCRMFGDCTSLTSVDMPWVTIIGERAFENCGSLTNVDIRQVTNISGKTFSGCNKLESVDMPLVTSVGAYAFLSCGSLTNVDIADSVTSIGHGAFSGCDNLIYNEFGDALYLGNADNPHAVLIRVKDTEKASFQIHTDTKVIAYAAFSGCGNITDIDIPDGVRGIGDYAFSGCGSLTYNEYDNALYLGNADNPYVALIKAKDTQITSCRIHEKTGFIYCHAFDGCSNLNSIDIPGGITEIGESAFFYCDNLTKIIMADSIMRIGYDAFEGCSKLNRVYYMGNSGGLEKISIGIRNDALYRALCFYSETEPTGFSRYWHYDGDGNIVEWPQKSQDSCIR